MQGYNENTNTFSTDLSKNEILASGARELGVPTPSLATPTHILKLNEGDYAFKEGDIPRGVYLLVSGAIKLVTHRPLTRGRVASSEFINKIVAPGEFFGFKALIKGTAFTYYARALKASEVHIFPAKLLEAGIHSTNQIGRGVLTQIANDLEGHEQIAQLHYLASVQERIAYQLALLAEKFGQMTADGLSLNLRLTRNELAQMAGTINESLSRHLTELRSEGVIDVHGKEIIVKNLPRLKEMSGNFHAGRPVPANI
jgi:CRP/FNR family cyclic AMP-dependent transcriptional regulator